MDCSHNHAIQILVKKKYLNDQYLIIAAWNIFVNATKLAVFIMVQFSISLYYVFNPLKPRTIS